MRNKPANGMGSLIVIRRWATAGCWVYGTILFGWLGLYLVTGDRIPYLALVNTLAVYLFLPLPAVVLLAAFLKRWDVWGVGLLGLATFVFLWGGLLIPNRVHTVDDKPVLRVMTFNVLGHHNQAQPIIRVITEADPDVVFLQELNSTLAAALNETLGGTYPYQILAPRKGVTGMGVISRYPIKSTGLGLPLEWVGDPQLLTLTWNSAEISLVNFHLYPSGLGTPGGVAYVYRAREAQARILAEYAASAAAHGPVVLAGDANITDLSEAYKILTAELHDTWREAGFGLGHTFPGSDIPGSSRPTVAGYPVPRWLARIDFILHSSQMESQTAYLGAIDGVSDHRAVVVDLVLK
jgi:endonuclease/exonuclease/phosphatase (EEP) superfamily protein YafD